MFLHRDLDLIIEVETFDMYGIIIKSFGWCIHSLKYNDGVIFKSKALSLGGKGMCFSTWKETYTKNLVLIDPLILRKIVKLVNINFITCQTLIKSFEDCGNIAVHIIDNRIDLDLGKDAICVTRHSISYIENSRYLPSTNKHISIENYNLLLSKINNIVEQIDVILNSLKEGA